MLALIIILIFKWNCKFCCTNINISLVFLVLYITDFLLQGEAEQVHTCSLWFVRVILMRLHMYYLSIAETCSFVARQYCPLTGTSLLHRYGPESVDVLVWIVGRTVSTDLQIMEVSTKIKNHTLIWTISLHALLVLLVLH